jgi:HAE1 family hydrophobic/amphiphilic exporter-1
MQEIEAITDSTKKTTETIGSKPPKVKIKQNLFTFFILNNRVTALFMIMVAIIGLFGLLNVDIEANPEVNQPIGQVVTFYPNAGPSDVEELVTKPLEEVIANLDSLKSYQSSSENNLSAITVNFENTVNTDDAVQKLQEAINKVSTLPDDAETPQVFKLDFNNQPIVTLNILGDLNKIELTEVAETVEQEIETISGVGKIDLSGNAIQNIEIGLDQGLLETFGITIGEIIGQLNANNINAPLGEVITNQENTNVRLTAKAKTLEELAQITIRDLSQQGTSGQIRLGDIAEISIKEATRETEAYVSDNKGFAQNTVSLSVFKQSGGNIVEIVDAIDIKITELNKTLPANIEILKTNDNAYFIKNDLKTLGSNGYQTLIIIFIALVIFLSVREALIAAIAIPFIFLITFAYVYLTGQTLNSLTIFALIMSLGLVVDNSIVIVEGVHDYRKQGYSKIESAYLAIKTFTWPLIAGTATTIAAFLPMLLVSGIVGEFIRTIPIILSITLIASIFVSFGFTPLLTNIILNDEDKENNEEKSGLFSEIAGLREQMITFLQNTYRNILSTIIPNKKLKFTILGGTIVAFILAMSLPATGLLKSQLFPSTDSPILYVNFEAPIGTPLSATKNLTEPIESVLNKYPAINNYVLNIGRNISLDFSSNSGTQSNVGHFIVNLKEKADFDREKSFVIAEQIRKELESLATDLKITVEEPSAGPPTAAPLEIKIIGSDLERLKTISNEVKSELSQINGLVNIKTDFDNTPKELNFQADPELLSYFGLTNQQLSLVTQALTNGIPSGEMSIGDDEYDIKIKIANSAEQIDVDTLAELPILTTKGSIPLSYLGTFEIENALQKIPHIDGDRTVRVRAYTEKDILITSLLPEINKKIETIKKTNQGYELTTGGEDEEIQKSFQELFSLTFLSIFLIIIILILVLNSFRQTFIILFSIPLAMIGVFPGLTAFGLALSFPAFLGIVMLTGIVVNDAIVLVDTINNRLKTGEDLNTAIIESGRSRLMPVILTSVTTILGLLSLTLTDEFWRGLGGSVIFGLSTATFFTLGLIPILVSLVYKRK